MNRQIDVGDAPEIGRFKLTVGSVPVVRLCRTFDLSPAAYYAEKKLAAKQGVLRFPRERRHQRAPQHASAEVVLAAIREIIANNRAWGVRKVWATLRRAPERDGKGLKVSRRRVHALMRANGLVLARDSEPGEPTRTAGSVAVPEPNRRLGTDLTTVWTKQDGVVAIVPTLDYGCRSALSLIVTKDQHGPQILTSLRAGLVEAFGSPANVPDGVDVRTDHGPQYTSGDCADLCAEWGVEQTFAPVGRPTGNAVVERFIRTMKEEVVWLRDWETADELRAALDAWVVHYNTRRPHQALGWLTPAEYRAQRLGRRLAA